MQPPYDRPMIKKFEKGQQTGFDMCLMHAISERENIFLELSLYQTNWDLCLHFPNVYRARL